MEDRMQPVEDPVVASGSRNLLTIFRRRLWIMIPVALAIVLAALIYAAVQQRMYEASTWMLVSSADSSPGGMSIVTEQDIWRSLHADISMHSRLIRSSEMATRVKEKLDLNEPVHEIVQKVSVDRAPGTSANVISISFRSNNPEKAKEICDAWATLYEEDSRQQSTRSTVSAIDYVESQIDTVSGELRQLEEQMANLEQEYLETGINITGGEAGNRIAELLSQVAENRIEMQAIEAQMERTQARLEEEPRELEEVEEEPSYQAEAIEEQLSQLHIEHQAMLQDYYEDSPEVRAIEDRIERLEGRLEQGDRMTRSAVTTQPNPVYLSAQNKLIDLYGQLDSLRARQMALQMQLGEQRTLAEAAPAGSIAYKELAREAEGLQSVHSFLLSRLHELQLTKAMAISPVQVVREAEVPQKPVAPNYRSIIGVGFIGAFLIAALAAVAVDQIDDTFADPEEIREALDTRLVGVLPESHQERQLHVQPDAPEDVTRTAFANALRMLASTVRIEMSQQGLVSLAVTSAGRSEGKTLVAANLAATLANAGERVLLIDADLHRPRAHTLFDAEREPGLSNLLVGDMEPEQVMQKTEVGNLLVITAGALPPSPVDLLASTHGQETIERLSDLADYVIWDTPPAGFLADATVISHATDRTLFVVGKNARRAAVRETVHNLREIGARLIGVCANQVRPTGASSYYYYYQDYYTDEE